MTEDYPFLGGNATFSVSPNPYFGTTDPFFIKFANDANFTIRDGDEYDFDPMTGVIELQAINNGTYTITETKGIPGVGMQLQPSVAVVDGMGTAYVTNIFINFTSQNTPIEMPAPNMNGNELIFLNQTLGAKINGVNLTANNLPSSIQVNKDYILSTTAPDAISFDLNIAPSFDTDSLFDNLGIPTYDLPSSQFSSNGTAFIPPIFVAQSTDGGYIMTSPKLNQVYSGSNLVLRFDTVNSNTIPLKSISFPFNVDSDDVGVAVRSYTGVPSGAPSFSGSAKLFLEISSTRNVNISDATTFATNPQLYFTVDKVNASCPSDVSVHLLMNEGLSSAHWHHISTTSNLQRETSLDTTNACGYVLEVDHFSSYLVGTGGSSSSCAPDDHACHASSGSSGHDHGSHSSHAGHDGGHGGHFIDCTINGLVNDIKSDQVYLNIHTDSDGNPETNTGPGDLYNPGEVRGHLKQVHTSNYFTSFAKPSNQVLGNMTNTSLWDKSRATATILLEQISYNEMRYDISGKNLPNVVGIHLHRGDERHNSHIHLADIFVPNNKTKSINLTPATLRGVITDSDMCPAGANVGHNMNDHADHTGHDEKADHTGHDEKADHTGHQQTLERDSSVVTSGMEFEGKTKSIWLKDLAFDIRYSNNAKLLSAKIDRIETTALFNFQITEPTNNEVLAKIPFYISEKYQKLEVLADNKKLEYEIADLSEENYTIKIKLPKESSALQLLYSNLE